MRNKIIQQMFLALAAFAACLFPVRAQPLSSNRWLIVADTSFSMARCAPAIQVAVQNLLLSGMNGQLRRGDTIGMWTFNEKLYLGQFPLLVWQPEWRQTVALRAVGFLKAQHYEKQTRFDAVVPDLNHVVTNSDVLTIIIITDGDGQISGTPFDNVINASFKQDYSYQKKIREPFVVALRAQGGKFTDYTVTLAPWLPKFPPLPPEPEVAPQPEPVPVPVPEPVPASVPVTPVPSLIISGKHPEPATTPEPVVPAVEQTVPVVVNSKPAPTVVPTPVTPEVNNAGSVPANPAPIPEPPPPSEAEKPHLAPAPNIVLHTAEDMPPVASAPVESVAPAPANPQPTITAPANPAPVQTGVVTPPEVNSGNQKTLLIGIALLIAALVVGIFVLRRPRHASHSSLISRSLDKDKK